MTPRRREPITEPVNNLFLGIFGIVAGIAGWIERYPKAAVLGLLVIYPSAILVLGKAGLADDYLGPIIEHHQHHNSGVDTTMLKDVIGPVVSQAVRAQVQPLYDAFHAVPQLNRQLTLQDAAKRRKRDLDSTDSVRTASR